MLFNKIWKRGAARDDDAIESFKIDMMDMLKKDSYDIARSRYR